MTSDEQGGVRTLKIGIVGGGERCKTILNMFQRQTPPRGKASVVLVADEKSRGTRLSVCPGAGY